MDIKEHKEKIKLLEKEVTLYKEILELKRQILECEKGLKDPWHWTYNEPWCNGTDNPLPPQNVTIC